MATIWVTSDTHFGHQNIIGYCKRPFASAEEMDEELVRRWNAVVRPQDHVYHLGDVAMRKERLAIVRRLNGHKRLVFGNHDIFDHRAYVEVGFEKVMGMRVLSGALLTHVPVHHTSMSRFVCNIHGHIHERPAYGPQYLNVSVERTDYTPVLLEQILADRARHRQELATAPIEQQLHYDELRDEEREPVCDLARRLILQPGATAMWHGTRVEERLTVVAPRNRVE